MGTCQGPVVKDRRLRSRADAASYSSTAAAADTFSDPIRPASGSAHELVAGRPHARAQAPALGAQHDHDAAAVVRLRVGASARRPRRRRPRRRARLAVAQEVGEVSHAGDRQVLDRARPRRGRRPASRARRPRSGITTPVAPAHSAVRQIAPRFCGSWTWSSATTSASSGSSSSAGVGVGVGLHLGHEALVVGRAAEPLELLGARPARASRASAAAAATLVDRPDARTRRRPRSASRTALRAVEDHSGRRSGTSTGPSGGVAHLVPALGSSSRSASARVEVAGLAGLAPARRQAGAASSSTGSSPSSRCSRPITVEHLGERRAGRPAKRSPPRAAGCPR